ncbi:MAG TPA: HDIG domain-containing protein [Longimicrobium sp.]|jgi:hypothetical protein
MVAAERPPERRAAPRDGDLPPRPRFARALHHGLRLAVLLATAAAIHLLFPSGAAPGPVLLERGVVAPEDIIAAIPFQIPKTEEELRREQEEAARGVPPVYDYAPGAADSVAGGLAGFFAAVEEALRGAPPGQETQAVRSVLSRSGVPTTLGAVEVLADSARRAALQGATVAAVRELFPAGVAASSPGRSGISAVRVRGVRGGERLVAADSLLTADQFYGAAAQRLPAGAGADAAELQRLLLVRWFQPSLAVNQAETEAARARARAAVDRVKARVLAGEKIVGAREQVGAREEERLRAYQAALAERRTDGEGGHAPARAAGAVLFNLLLLGIVGFLLRLSRAHLYDDDRTILFLGMLTVAVAALASVIARLDLPPELIPVPFATMVLAVLWGGRLALAMALILALVLGGQAPFLGLAVPFTVAVGGAAGAFGVRVAERRLQTWMVVGIITAAYAAAALSVGLLRAWSLEEIGWSALWGAVNATGSSLLAVGFLPVAEWFTGVTTNQTLQELADPKHPLLKRLSLEAPGTYAHTISVANLAEAACNAIGANALLARVGVYYHDIGKVVKPQYFIENQPKGRNPHDKLKPAMSAAIVRSHVAEGLKLAEQHRLPDAVKAFITQHHGTQPISFFKDQAKAADPEGRINPADYAYQGPRPQTRETAVVMLADSVESAARVLQDPTPARIRELVDRIVGAKIAAGQLDESPLTLREINIVKEVLARSLSGMYHSRLDYPAPPPAAQDGEAANGGAQPEPAATGAGTSTR